MADSDEVRGAYRGREGGLKGGVARAAKLTPEQRREIAAKGGRKMGENAKLRKQGIDPKVVDGVPQTRSDRRNTTAQQRWMRLFHEFISYLSIDSKETGVSPLKLYQSQRRFLLEVCEGLDRGVRHFVCLKARQLGISTVCLAIDLFWLTVHEGLQGALIVDTEGNRDKFRILIERYIASLPRGLRVGIIRHNRTNLVLRNGSVLDYVVAGTKRTGTMARSRAWNFVHATECSSWGSSEGVASMVASLAQKHPHRLYIFESTARGYNLFFDMWSDAGEDTHTQKRFFIGWWSKEDYRAPRGSDLFKHYAPCETMHQGWEANLDDGERAMVAEVKAKYGVQIDPEQIAWHRWMRSVKISDDDLFQQEYPATADQAFIMSGKSFFPQHAVAADIRFIKETKILFKGFRYHLGDNFLATEVEPVARSADADLRVWEEPNANGVYVMGVDPAFGRSDLKDRHAIAVYRCYADALIQVAEYATSDPETYQLAWVMAHLAGSYKNVWINLEINGPGPAVMNELRHLKQLIDGGYLQQAAAEKQLSEVFQNVRWYLYHRPDSMSAGFVYNWKSTTDNKLLIMNQMRDAYSLKALRVRSLPLLDEMRTMVQDGAQIEAEGRAKDDRVVATALANKAYIEWVRPSMISQGLTYERVTAFEREAEHNPSVSFVSAMVSDFFKGCEEKRLDAQIQKAWGL